MSDGLIPALNAARTALTWARVNEIVATSAFTGTADLPRRDERVTISSLFGNLPRRFASLRHIAISRSNSPSGRCLTALATSLGDRKGTQALCMRRHVSSWHGAEC